ncbi:hypothetical protein CRENBAI_013337, partial [Crenichthys baileyi]
SSGCQQLGDLGGQRRRPRRGPGGWQWCGNLFGRQRRRRQRPGDRWRRDPRGQHRQRL